MEQTAQHTPERDYLIGQWQSKRHLRNEYIRQAVLKDGRMDVLAKLVFEKPDLIIKPFHHTMVQFQEKHDKGMVLCYRGAGKSQLLTIGRAVFELLRNPDVRILLASRTCSQAETFLRGVKKRLQGPQLVEIFGNQVGTDKWDTREINVSNRTSSAMESNVSTVGIDGAVVSRHFDIIIADDLVGMDNSRTHNQREKIKQWYYTELDPTLEEDGKIWVIGTRYHYSDLYGHFMKNEYKNKMLVIRALDDQGRSPWPERHPPDWFEKKRRDAGSIVFNCQYQLDTDAMKGDVFKEEYFQYYDSAPDHLPLYQGVDVAIGLQQFHDYFVIVTIAYDKKENKTYVLDYYRSRVIFPEQVKQIYERFMHYDPVRVGIESNAFQKAVYQDLRASKKYKVVRAHPLFTTQDKTTRFTKLAARFENGDVLLGKNMPELEDELLAFPSGDHDDLIDGVELAIRMATLRKMRKERIEPGVI